MTYIVVIPSDQASRRTFSNLRDAKAYLRTLPGGYGDDAGILLDDDMPSRNIRHISGRIQYVNCPTSWKK